jgi:FixJ family two-component response regulator
LNIGKKEIVAVVDDNAIMLKSLLRLLDAHGYAPLGFASAEAFLDDESATKAACLVLDVNLDGLSGIQLRRQLTASGNPLPVIFITARDNEATEQEATASGCVAYLHKPFSGTLLIGAIDKATR